VIDWVSDDASAASDGVDLFSARFLSGDELASRVQAAARTQPVHRSRAISVRDRSGKDLVLLSSGEPAYTQLGLRTLAVDPTEAAAIASFRTLGDLSHDLGGPVTGVVAAIDAMLDPEPPPDGHELLMEAREEMMRMVELVRRRREGVDTRVSTRGTVDVRSIIDVTLTALKGELTRANIETRNELRPVVGSFDSALIRSCITALVLNAIETSRRRAGYIVVRAKSDGGWMELQVEDAGRGMSRDDVAAAGTLFHSTRRTGAGTGLASVRHAMAVLDGFLTLDTEANVGTIATLNIPIGRD
jgi:signal transduction histidine kinase